MGSSRIVAPTPAPTTSLPSPACHTSLAGEDCYAGVQWAMEHGIHRHPQWYPNLSSSSSFADFQSTLHEGGHNNCPMPCEPVPTPKTTPAPASAPTPATTPTPTLAPTPAPMQDATPQCELTIRLY